MNRSGSVIGNSTSTAIVFPTDINYDNETTHNPIPLPFWTCFFLNSHNGTYPTTQHNVTLTCSPQGKFLFGNGPGTSEYGNVVCIVLAVLIWITGLTGLISNTLCVVFIPRSMKNLVGSLSFLVVALAVLEMLTCTFGIISVTAIILILENAARNKVIFYFFYIFQPLYSYSRVGVIYTTTLISIERYLSVTFPTRSKSWLTSLKSKICFLCVIIFAFVVDLPGLFHVSLEENIYRPISHNTSLADFPYIFKYRSSGKSRNIWFALYVIKIGLPVILLIYFNWKLYQSIRMWNKRKRALTNSQKREIDAANMLSAVIVLIFLWNIPYFLSFIIENIHQGQDDAFRELMFFKMFCMSISTNVNFFMYFRYGKRFRQEIIKFTGIQWDEVDEKSPNVSRNNSLADI